MQISVEFSKISMGDYSDFRQLGYQLKKPNHGKSVTITNTKSHAFMIVFPNDQINLYGAWTIQDTFMVLPFLNRIRVVR